MSNICWLLVFSWLLLGIAEASEANATTGKTYYKKSTAAAEPQPVSQENIQITMEGQKQKKKTVPRKGVLPDESIEITGQMNIVNDTISQKTNSSIVTEPSKHISIKLSTTAPSFDTTNKSALHVAPVKEEPEENLAKVLSSSTTRKPKPKPSLTIGGKEADGPIPALPTDKSPIIMPRKIDYIVPMVITFTALPLLGITFYVLYKRGKDYWSKRHYRRMDFLIDGMYNE